MNRWIVQDRAIGIVDNSNTQSNGMLIPICYLETYDHSEEMVEYYSNLICNAEPMLDLLRDLYYTHGYELPDGSFQKIEKLLGDLL